MEPTKTNHEARGSKTTNKAETDGNPIPRTKKTTIETRTPTADAEEEKGPGQDTETTVTTERGNPDDATMTKSHKTELKGIRPNRATSPKRTKTKPSRYPDDPSFFQEHMRELCNKDRERR
jgi:hypothetical protein